MTHDIEHGRATVKTLKYANLLRVEIQKRRILGAVISVVVPVHNEERTSACSTRSSTPRSIRSGDEWEVVYVDDGSTDGSFAALTRLHAAPTNVRVVRLRRNFGKAAALAAGFAQARGDVVVTIDGDLQDDPSEIPRLLAKLDEGFDLVSGWKTRRRDPLDAPHPVAALQLGRRAGCPASACTT